MFLGGVANVVSTYSRHCKLTTTFLFQINRVSKLSARRQQRFWPEQSGSESRNLEGVTTLLPPQYKSTIIICMRTVSVISTE